MAHIKAVILQPVIVPAKAPGQQPSLELGVGIFTDSLPVDRHLDGLNEAIKLLDLAKEQLLKRRADAAAGASVVDVTVINGSPKISPPTPSQS